MLPNLERDWQVPDGRHATGRRLANLQKVFFFQIAVQCRLPVSRNSEIMNVRMSFL